MHWSRSQSGISLVEILVAGGIFALVISALIGSYLTGQESTALAGTRERAVLLADEGIEAARSIRDGGWNNLTDGTYGLVLAGDVWTLSGSSDVTDIFTRSVTISTISDTAKDVVVDVDWRQNGQRSGSISMETRLTDWQLPAMSERVFRTHEYYLGSGTFSGTAYDLTLNNDLAQNYFVIVQGSDGDGSGIGNRGPDENYIALTGDPFGTGDLNTTSSTNIISLTRQSAVDSWVGVVTVVECVQNCDTAGFTLDDVQRVTHSNTTTSGTDTSASWTNLTQVMLMAGFNGAGCDTTQSNVNNTKVCHTRIWPSGTNTINWERSNAGATMSTATSTVMVVEWGSEWTVQRATVTGAAGGDGADATSEYNTASINPVDREHTWVWGGGVTAGTGVGGGAEGTLITLGDGVNQNATESTVAIGQEYSNNRTVDVYAVTHPLLQVDYRFKNDGNDADVTYDVTVDMTSDASGRIALVTNGQNGTTMAYPRPMFSARYYNDTTIRLERRRSGAAWPAWIQGVNFSSVVPNWWDTSYAYRAPLTISTGPNAPANSYAGYTVHVSLNTNPAISQGKMQANCNDLRIVRDTGSGWQELDRQVVDCGSSTTDVRFKLVADIADNSSDTSYYMYYGNISAGAPAALGTTNIYLWYDDATSNLLSSYVLGRCDAWEGTGYTPWTYNGAGYYAIDTGDNVTSCFRYPTNERDAYIEAELYHIRCYPDNMSTGLIGRYTVDSGTGGSEDSNTYYASNRAEQSSCGKGYPHDGDICEGGRCPLGIDGKNPKAIATDQWRKQALALWGINSTQARFWDEDTVSAFGPIGWPSTKVATSGSDASDIETSGAWGIIATQDDLRVRNVLIRRYTDPEPSVSIGGEETQ